MAAPRVWIVPVNFNGLEDTRKCLRSLAALSSPASVVVVDNASNEDPTAILKQEFPAVHLIRNPINAGWSGGNNAGIRFALARGADFILLLNNDTTVHPDLVARLLAAAESHPQCGIVGPVIRYMDEPELAMTDGTRFNRPGYPGFFQRQPVPEREGLVEETDIVNGCCMMVRAAEGLVWHKGSSAFKRSGKRWQRYYDTRNLGLLLAKHRTERSKLSSYSHYLRYAYHRYCHEREDGQLDAALAVLEGLVDAATRRFGPYEKRPRWAVPAVHCLFETARRLKPSKQNVPIAARKDLA